jgi:CheY-like chemotaxis protein
MTNKLLDRECRNVLVIEDDESIRSCVVEILRQEGYEVHEAENGKNGMEMLKTLPGPTLVLLDMMMPVMNGWQFIEAQKKNAKFADISVVVVSATPADRALLTNEGVLPVEGMLRKPFDPDNLLKVVSGYCVPMVNVEAASAL